MLHLWKAFNFVTNVIAGDEAEEDEDVLARDDLRYAPDEAIISKESDFINQEIPKVTDNLF